VNGEVRGESVVLAVVDDGDGVPSESRSQIFQPFFTTRATGTGLGLRVVQRIAEAHGGRIVHSETPGGGATFELVLPIHGEGPASA
jgi:signal transduction histidine kinase